MKKTLTQLKRQKVSIFFELAIMRIDGKITREKQQSRCRQAHKAYEKAYQLIIAAK